MDSFEELMKKLRDQAVADAMRLDPEFAAKVEADRQEILEHDKRLEAQRDAAKQKEVPAEAAERKQIWGKMIESQQK